MRLIFLDFDGVLNSYAPTTIKRPCQFDYAPECIEALEWLMRRTDALIVLSTSWRGVLTEGEAQRDLIALGAASARVISKTPQLETHTDYEGRKTGLVVAKSRGDEIEEWISQRRISKLSFVVLDDYCDAKMKAMPHIETDFNTGLTMEDARRAAAFLNGTCGTI